MTPRSMRRLARNGLREKGRITHCAERLGPLTCKFRLTCQYP